MLLKETALFVRAFEEKSISAATRSIGLSTAAASTRPMQLERHLGVQLFARTTRSLSPTGAGELFYGHAIEILETVEMAQNSIVDLTDTPRGVLKVSAPLGFGRHVLAPLLVDFQMMYPHIDVRLRLAESDIDLFSGHVDMAVKAGPLQDSTCTTRKIADCPQVMCASPGYLAKHGAPETPADLLAHNCLSQRSDGRKPHPWWLWLGATEGFGPLHVAGRLEADDGDVLTGWALQDEGIVLRPYWEVADHLDEGRLIELLPGFAPAPVSLNFVYPHRRFVAAKIKLFADFLIPDARKRLGRPQVLAV